MNRIGSAAALTSLVVALTGATLIVPPVSSAHAGVTGCAPVPLATCNGIDGHQSSASLDLAAVHDGAQFVAGKGKLNLKVTGLLNASLADLGAPGGSESTDATMTDDLQLCIYDAGVAALDLAIAAGAPGWTCRDAKSCKLKGSEPSGLVNLQLIADTKPADGKESSVIRLKIASKKLPEGLSIIEEQNPWAAGADADVFDGVGGDIVVQLVNRASGACWSFNLGGNGAGVDPTKTKNSPLSSGKPRLRAKLKIKPDTCPNPEEPQCVECPAGTYLSGTLCSACAPVAGCIGAVTCSAGTDSRCPQCAAGKYLHSEVSDTCLDCTPLPGCVDEICVDASSSQCTQCEATHYLSSGTCSACTDIAFCATAETCSSPTNSQCVQCESGYWMNGSGSADICNACTPVPHCVTPLTCTSATNPQCTQCEPGYYLDSEGGHSVCRQCNAVENCSVLPSCNSATDSSCAVCGSGFWRDTSGSADSCVECTGVEHCVSPLTCTSAGDSNCTHCEPGYYLTSAGSSSLCAQCAAIPGCTSQPVCTTATDSQCTSCAAGKYLQHGVADSCIDCTPIPGCMGQVLCTGAANSVCV
ncbi:MAG TPA: hypothetical protein VEB21_04150 [Terriglobales bacterium]|nr:hypothetical protein [Terriglobales bacterium]